MFPNGYFAPHYFAPRYFPRHTGVIPSQHEGFSVVGVQRAAVMYVGLNIPLLYDRQENRMFYDINTYKTVYSVSNSPMFYAAEGGAIMIIPQLNVYVGESIPIRYSLLNLLKDFQNTAQSLVGASITWSSQTPSLATFDIGSEGLITSDQGAADGIANDAVIGSFTMLASGICTVKFSVDAINPVATYVGVIRLGIEAVPIP